MELVAVAVVGFLVGAFMLVVGARRREVTGAGIGLALIVFSAGLGALILLILAVASGE